MVNPSFWYGKSVFVTGHTGFKGSWLTYWLHQLGANITGYSLDPEPQHKLFQDLGISKKLTDCRGNICNLEDLSGALKNSEPDIVIHLAAQSIVRTSFQRPLSTIETNVLGTATLLQACRSISSIRAVLIVTSDKCYENVGATRPYNENDALGGHDLYSASKACAEIISQAYRASFYQGHDKVGVATARAGNVIGGGDWAKDRIVPDAIRAFRENNILKIRNPDAIRPWQHVLEPLSGYLSLAEHLYTDPESFSSSWNFGPHLNDTVSVASLCDVLVNHYGGETTWEFEQPQNPPPEAALLRLSIDKANAHLTWSPKWNLQSAVKHTIDWYKADHRKEDLHSITKQQILRYQSYSDDH